jgi:site-specific DNA-cytosine methylase
VLSRSHPGVPAHDDVRTLAPPSVEYVLGGWPCQDLSIAGLMEGLVGSQSSLFYELCRVVTESKAHTAIAENVPGLFLSNRGQDFFTVVKSLVGIGLNHVAWRTLNSIEFGLPQHRERVFVVASRHREIALSIHACTPKPSCVPPRPKRPSAIEPHPDILGFYWTGGGRSLCVRKNSVPTLKVGAPSEKGGTSPVAIFWGDTVRKLSPEEAISLQGFDPHIVQGLQYGHVLRMAGDAVSRPVGAFVVDSVFYPRPVDECRLRPAIEDVIPPHGYMCDGAMSEIRHDRCEQPLHIAEFVDLTSKKRLSPQAAAGLCCRIIRSQADVPASLFACLYEMSKTRTKLIGTKVDSFSILHNELDPAGYLQQLAQQMRVTQLGLFPDGS